MARNDITSSNEKQSAATAAAPEAQENKPDIGFSPEAKSSQPEASMSERQERPSRGSLEEDTRKYFEERKQREAIRVGQAENTQGVLPTPPGRKGYTYMWVRDDGKGISDAVLAGYKAVPRHTVPEIYRGAEKILANNRVDDVVRNGDLVLYEILNLRLEENEAEIRKNRDKLNEAANEKLDVRDENGNRRFEGGITQEIDGLPGQARVPRVADNISN